MALFLRNRPEEQKVVGQILTSFGDVEYQLSCCVGSVLNNPGAGTRALFRLTGGNVRLQVADAICRDAFEAINLKNEYEAALGAVRGSATIRNQYAHCHFWDGKEHGLYFTDLRDAASTAIGDLFFKMRHIDLPLLVKQVEYVQYAFHWLMFLHQEYEVRALRLSSQTFAAPKIIHKPPLHNPAEEHPLPKREKDDELPLKSPPAAEH